MELHAGDRVPADLRIVAMKTATLRAEQSSLTGESVAVNKGVGAVAEEGCELQARGVARPFSGVCTNSLGGNKDGGD